MPRKTYVHVNHLAIRSNAKAKEFTEPVITVHRNGRQVWCNEVEIKDSRGRVVARVRYEPERPLKTGATVWIEADHINIKG